MNVNVVKLHVEQKKVSANMLTIKVGKWKIPTMSRVVPIPEGEMKVVNYDTYDQQQKGLIPFSIQKREIM